MRNKMTERKPHIAGLKSAKIEVTAGKEYWWCSCGLSQNQPFCDGTHSGSDFVPILFKPEQDGIVGFCLCKYSQKEQGVICDGAHKQLAGYNPNPNKPT